jgi:hypothetical protein
MSRFPWVRRTAPIHANEEDDESCGEQENANPVKGLELFHLGFAADVKHFLRHVNLLSEKFEGLAYICRWVVENIVETDSKCVDNNTKDIAPSPLEVGVEV